MPTSRIALDHLRGGRKDDAVATLRKVLRVRTRTTSTRCTRSPRRYWGDEQQPLGHRGHAAARDRARARDTPRPGACSAPCCTIRIVRRRRFSATSASSISSRATPSAWAGLGADYAQVGDMERSAEAYARSIALQPGLPGVHMSHAHALKSLGRQAEALREYRAAIALKPEFGEAYWSMANLKVFRFEPAEVAAMEQQLKRRGPDRERRRPLPFRARQGLRGCGRLRPRLELLPGRQPAPAAARFLRPGRVRDAARGDRGGLQPRVPGVSTRARASSRTRRSSSSACRARARR